jgi:hypothetical protein
MIKGTKELRQNTSDEREEICSFIRDQMLTTSKIDAGFVWHLYKEALNDMDLYQRMNMWMRETNANNRNTMLLGLVFYVQDRNAHDSNR